MDEVIRKVLEIVHEDAKKGNSSYSERAFKIIKKSISENFIPKEKVDSIIEEAYEFGFDAGFMSESEFEYVDHTISYILLRGEILNEDENNKALKWIEEAMGSDLVTSDIFKNLVSLIETYESRT